MRTKPVEPRIVRRCAALILSSAAVVVPLAAQDAVLLAEQADGAIALEAESRIRIIEITGTVVLRTAKAGELIYAVRALDNRREERPAALWSNGRTLELRPVDDSTEPLLVEIAVPEQLMVEIELSDSNLQIAGLRGDLELRGRELDVDARGLQGVVELTVSESTVRLNGTVSDVTVDAEAIDLVLDRIGGDLTLSLVDTNVEAATVNGELNAHLQNTVLQARGLAGNVRLDARGGSVGLAHVKGTVEARFAEAPFTLDDVAGRVTIETDSDVEFRAAQAALSIDAYGGRIRGTECSGPVELRADHARVALEQMKGKLTVTGDGLQVALRAIENDATVKATSTSVSVEQASGPLEIQTDFGDVRVQEASGPVRIVSSEGSVRVAGMSGPLEVRASGANVDVGWAQISREKDQFIENDNGPVTVRLPAKALCRIEIETSFGHVESNLPAVQVTDDGKFASGAFGGASKPLIRVNSAGDVLVTAQQSAPGP